MNGHPLSLLRDARLARRRGAAATEQRQRARFSEIVAYAREHSPLYRDLYEGLPDRVDDPRQLPVTTKAELMAGFDGWATDRQVTLERARAFAEDLTAVGTPFLGSYLLASSSGTTGARGIFVIDDHALAVNDAVRLRALGTWIKARDLFLLFARGARTAMFSTTGGHFVGPATMRRGRWRRRAVRVLSVYEPLADLVQALNRMQPAIINGYAGTIAALATEQEAERLRISPLLALLSAEGLPEAERERIGRAFGARVRDTYAATECPFIGHSCAHGWIHVNSDWVVLEPVNADYQPVAPGRTSHTVLLSNLANRVQPILRYDLGDSIVAKPDACPCGNPLPAIRVEGRTGEPLVFPSPGGNVALMPLALGGVLDRVAGVSRFQIVQSAPAALRVRLEVAAGAESDRVWQESQAAISGLLAESGLEHVSVERAAEPPRRSGSKYRKIIPLDGG